MEKKYSWNDIEDEARLMAIKNGEYKDSALKC